MYLLRLSFAKKHILPVFLCCKYLWMTYMLQMTSIGHSIDMMVTHTCFPDGIFNVLLSMSSQALNEIFPIYISDWLPWFFTFVLHTSSTQVHPTKIGHVLVYSPVCLASNLFSMQDKLVNNKHTFSQTKLLCYNNTNQQKGVRCWLVFELILLFVGIVFWCCCCSLFRIMTLEIE